MCSAIYLVILLSLITNAVIAQDDLAPPAETEPPPAPADDVSPDALPPEEPDPDLPATNFEIPAEDFDLDAEPSQGINPKVRIVGGDVATDRARFAYQVSVRQVKSNFHFCGATIIHLSHALTAAHCVFNDATTLALPATISVVVGDLNTRRETDATVYRTVSDIFPHPEYSHATFQHDVAVLRLSKALDGFTPYVNSLPLASLTPPENTSCTVSGWGTTASEGPASDALRFVAVPIVNRRICMTRYGNTIMNGMICAGFMNGGRDACQGDSGGPLICNEELAGVVSWGYGCAAAGFPGIYADVATYKTWIEEQIDREGAVQQYEELPEPSDDQVETVNDVLDDRKSNSQPPIVTGISATLLLAVCSFVVLT